MTQLALDMLPAGAWQPSGERGPACLPLPGAAAARGEDVGPAVAELRAELVEDMGRTLGRLSGPHALVEVARLAGVDDATPGGDA